MQKLFVEQGVHSGSVFQQVAAGLSDNEVFLAVKDAKARRRIFDVAVAQQRKELLERAAAQRAESDFRILLRGTPVFNL